MKTTIERNEASRRLLVISVRAIMAAGFLFCAISGRAQGIPQPVLAITPAVSNQVVISITNGVSLANYDLTWTPYLNNPDYPWTYAAIGSTGQTNFTLSVEWPTAFFRAVVDTNGVPLWEAADPNNPGAGVLAVFIDKPANGAVVQ